MVIDFSITYYMETALERSERLHTTITETINSQTSKSEIYMRGWAHMVSSLWPTSFELF
jgi:hypothetical protein